MRVYSVRLRCPFGGISGCENVIEATYDTGGQVEATGCQHVAGGLGDATWKAILVLAAIQQALYEAWQESVERDING